MVRLIRERITELEKELDQCFTGFKTNTLDGRKEEIRKKLNIMTAINHNRSLLGLIPKYDTDFNPDNYKG